jgi:hypothetical protein
MRSRPDRAVCLAALSALALLPATAAAATGLASEDHAFPAPPVDSTAVQAAFAPNGFAAVAWVEQIAANEGAVEVALRPPGGDWSAPTRLSTRQNAGDPPSGRTLDQVQVAVDADGDAAVAWHEHKTGVDVVAVSSRAANGDFTRPETFNPGQSPRVGVDGSGLVTFFDSFDTAMTDRTLVRDTRAGGSFTGTFPVNLSTTCGASDADLAVASSGDAIVSFGCNGMSYSLRHNGLWGPVSNPFVETFFSCPSPSTSRTFLNGRVAIDGGGHPVGVVQRNDVSTDCGAPPNLQRSNTIQLALPAGGAMTAGPVVAVSGTGSAFSPIANDTLQPDVGIGGGDVVAEWTAGNTGGTGFHPVTRTYPGNGGSTPAPPAPIGNFVDGVSDADLNVAANGLTLVDWTQITGSESRVLADVRPQGGGFGAPLPVTDGLQNAALASSGLSDAGDGVVAFVEGPSPGRRVAHARGFDATPPRLTGVVAPPAVQAGAPAGFQAQTFDVWGPVTVGWDFGDGTASGAGVQHAFAAPGAHTVAATATDSVGNSVSATSNVDVAAAPGGGGGPDPGPGPLTVAPGLTGVSETNAAFRVGPQATPVDAARRRRPPVGTTFRFALDQPASVSIEIAQALPGRKSGRRCVKTTKRNARKRRCTRLVRRGTLKRGGKLGANSVPFSGRIGRRALKPGAYRVTFTATAAGLTSKPVVLRFRVVR